MKNLTIITFLVLSSCISAQTLPNYIPANGLVGWWPFNGNANDFSANGNNGTAFGPTLTTDRLGNANSAYSFNGTGDYIQVPDAPSLNLLDSASFSFWMSWNGDNNNIDASQTIIDKSTISDIENYRIAIVEPTGNPANQLGVLSNQIEINSASVYNTTQWYHTVVTIQSGVICIYINGVLDYTGVLNLTATNTNDLLFGKDIIPSGVRYFFGKLDDIGIWNRALTPCEIKHIYESGSSGLTLSANMTSYCLADAAGTLSGNPPGGIWSGPGVTGNSFDPLVADTGSHNVIYTYTDSTGCANSDSLQLTVDFCTGMSPLPNTGAFALTYPNPAEGFTTAIWPEKENVKVIRLTDATGRTLRRWNVEGSSSARLSLEGIDKGIFFLVFEGDARFIQPIVRH